MEETYGIERDYFRWTKRRPNKLKGEDAFRDRFEDASRDLNTVHQPWRQKQDSRRRSQMLCSWLAFYQVECRPES